MEREAKTGPVVYCGPSVRGVARQYTVYAGTIPAALADFIQAHPAAKGLLVSVGRFAQVRSKTPSTFPMMTTWSPCLERFSETANTTAI